MKIYNVMIYVDNEVYVVFPNIKAWTRREAYFSIIPQLDGMNIQGCYGWDTEEV